MKTSIIIITTLKKDIWLNWYDNKCKDPDYARHEYKLEAGIHCPVLIEKHNDGRTYFRYFDMKDGNLYTNISMTDKDGKWYPNCGMMDYLQEKVMIDYFKQNCSLIQ